MVNLHGSISMSEKPLISLLSGATHKKWWHRQINLAVPSFYELFTYLFVLLLLSVKSRAASLGPLETVRVSVNLLSSFVLHRPPGISANCRNVVGIGRNAFQSGWYSNGGRRCTQLLMNWSLLFIIGNFVNQLLGRRRYCDSSLFRNHHSNNRTPRQSGLGNPNVSFKVQVSK